MRLAKGRTIGWPRGETADAIFTVGNARPLDQALQHATTEMLAWLASDYGLDAAAASHLLGQVVRYDIANVFNPAYSVACRVEKKWLERGGRRGRQLSDRLGTGTREVEFARWHTGASDRSTSALPI